MHALNLHNGHIFRKIFRRKIWKKSDYYDMVWLLNITEPSLYPILSRETEEVHVGLISKYLNLFLFLYRWSVNENST